MLQTVRIVMAATLWMLAVGLLLVHSIFGAPDVLRPWAVLVALVAHALTVWQMLAHERMRVEAITRIAIQAAAQHGGLRNLRE